MARVYAFRGRRAGLIKLVWHDGIGLCMLTKRLERGHFIWPSASTRPDRVVVGAIVDAARRLRVHIDKVSGASDLAKAMRYALRHWPGLTVFLDDGRIQMIQIPSSAPSDRIP